MWNLQLKQLRQTQFSNVLVLRGHQLGERYSLRVLDTSIHIFKLKVPTSAAHAFIQISLLQAQRKELVIFGNGAGQLTAFDTAFGEEVWRLENCHQGCAVLLQPCF